MECTHLLYIVDNNDKISNIYFIYKSLSKNLRNIIRDTTPEN